MYKLISHTSSPLEHISFHIPTITYAEKRCKRHHLPGRRWNLFRYMVVKFRIVYPSVYGSAAQEPHHVYGWSLFDGFSSSAHRSSGNLSCCALVRFGYAKELNDWAGSAEVCRFQWIKLTYLNSNQSEMIDKTRFLAILRERSNWRNRIAASNRHFKLNNFTFNSLFYVCFVYGWVNRSIVFH